MEDYILLAFHNVLDATRLSDGATVGIKCLKDNNTSMNEVEITRFFSSDTLRDDPDNHCVQLLDVLHNPDEPNLIFLVEPWVIAFGAYPFSSPAEVVDFMEQLLQGLEFMHRHNVAHRDCTTANIRMDARLLNPAPVHPLYPSRSLDSRTFVTPLTRTQAGGVKYYFIDFGLSTHFTDDATSRLVTGVDGRDRDVPELSDSKPYDPFKVDIYILGNLFRHKILDVYQGCDFSKPLVAAMTRLHPIDRPSARDALHSFQRLKRQLPGSSLRWTLHKWDQRIDETIFLNLVGIWRELKFQIRRILFFA